MTQVDKRELQGTANGRAIARRTFTAGALALAAAPGGAWAQAPGSKPPRIILVTPANPVEDIAELGVNFWRGFFQGLRQAGFVEGPALTVERVSGMGREAEFAQLARDLIARQPDVLVVASTRIVRELKLASVDVPVVAIMGDPVANGIVPSLARPGGSITGFSIDPGVSFFAMHLQLLHEAVPAARRVAYVTSRAFLDLAAVREVREGAANLGLSLVEVALESPIDDTEYRRAFATLSRERVEAAYFSSAAENRQFAPLIGTLARRINLPVIGTSRDIAEHGGLITYGYDAPDIYRRAADYVARILRGARPADLPFQQPTKFEMILNMKTARALGLEIPFLVLARADEVIE